VDEFRVEARAPGSLISVTFPLEKWLKLPRIAADAYEALPDMWDGEAKLSAAYTANNGIRLQIHDEELSPDWAVFDFTDDQAEAVGQALVRWARARRGTP
jgi:hypothetical protein